MKHLSGDELYAIRRVSTGVNVTIIEIGHVGGALQFL